MTYPRKYVRRQIGDLVDGIPGIKRVYLTRRWPREPAKLPCLCVYLPNENIAQVAGTGRPGSRMQTRTMVARIVAVFADPGVPDEAMEDGLDDTLDEVETRLASNPHLRDQSGKPFSSDLKFTRLDTGFDDKGSANVVIGALTYSVTVNHREGTPSTPHPRARAQGDA